MNPSPEQIRSRQTAYLATEAWWKTRVERLAEKWREDASRFDSIAASIMRGTRAELLAKFYESQACACREHVHELEALLAERPSR